MRAHRGTLRTLSSVRTLRTVVPAAGTAIHGTVSTPVGLLNEQHLEYASVNNSATHARTVKSPALKATVAVRTVSSYPLSLQKQGSPTRCRIEDGRRERTQLHQRDGASRKQSTQEPFSERTAELKPSSSAEECLAVGFEEEPELSAHFEQDGM
ncbi:hypothetical protein V5799_031056 [Amblyomma americanum]|uniref:Uncharacterized protein n=1 Tax=Amblyomma americanum TaxID=6943 RepID=A0AAQ4ELM1_AMBAM